MPTNRRVIYAIKQAAIAPDGVSPPVYIPIHGLQSCGITTSFNLEQLFEMGQLAIYDNVENIPEIEVTLEKVLDGYPLMFHLATNGASAATLIGRSNVKVNFGLAIFQDTSSSATGTPISELRASGMFVSACSYTFPVEGSCSESVTLVGNNKVWYDIAGGASAVNIGAFNNADAPLSTGVQRRQDVLFSPVVVSGSPSPALDVNGATNQWMTVLPSIIPGISSSGTIAPSSDGTYPTPVQSISISCDLGRDSIYELGRKSPYFRYVNFPVEVRCEIEVITTSSDGVSGTEDGGQNGAAAGSNLKNQTIRVRTRDSTMVDLGTKSKLTSVSFQGGDAGTSGGNTTNRYSFVTYNDLLIQHSGDPSGF